MRNEINLTDQEVIEKFDDAFGISVEMEEMIFSRDSLQDFMNARKEFSDPGKLTVNKPDYIEISGVQHKKGTPRKDLRILILVKYA